MENADAGYGHVTVIPNTFHRVWVQDRFGTGQVWFGIWFGIASGRVRDGFEAIATPKKTAPGGALEGHSASTKFFDEQPAPSRTFHIAEQKMKSTCGESS